MDSKWRAVQIIQSILIFKFVHVFIYYACDNEDLSFIFDVGSNVGCSKSFIIPESPFSGKIVSISSKV